MSEVSPWPAKEREVPYAQVGKEAVRCLPRAEAAGMKLEPDSPFSPLQADILLLPDLPSHSADTMAEHYGSV